MSYRLPYYQLASKWMATDAPIVAALLRVGDAPVTLREIDRMIGLGARLFAYAVDATSTAEKPPDGVFVGPFDEVADLLEAAVQWDGTRGALAAALIRAGVIERLEVGLRVRGTERYKATWEKNRRRNTGKGKTGAKPDGSGPVPAGSGAKPGGTVRETETETETDESQQQHLAGADAPAGQPRPAGPIQTPTPPANVVQVPAQAVQRGDFELVEQGAGKRERKLSAAQEFAAWAAERSGRQETLAKGTWVHIAEGLKRYGSERMRPAYLAFLADRWARSLDPPCPMRAFAAPSKLEEYVSAGDRRGGDGEEPECEVCGKACRFKEYGRDLCEECRHRRAGERIAAGYEWTPEVTDEQESAAVAEWIQNERTQRGAA